MTAGLAAALVFLALAAGLFLKGLAWSREECRSEAAKLRVTFLGRSGTRYGSDSR